MTIRMDQRADEPTRTPAKPCRWIAEAVIDGQAYSARSRYGAAHELARHLVAAGTEDQPVDVHSGRPGCTSYRSLYAMAEHGFTESPTSPLYRSRYVAPQDRFSHLGNRVLSPSSEGPATTVAAEASPP